MIIKTNTYIRPLKGQTLNPERYSESLKTNLDLIFKNKEYYGRVPEIGYMLNTKYNKQKGVLSVKVEYRYKINMITLVDFIDTLIKTIAASERMNFFVQQYNKLSIFELKPLRDQLLDGK